MKSSKERRIEKEKQLQKQRETDDIIKQLKSIKFANNGSKYLRETNTANRFKAIESKYIKNSDLSNELNKTLKDFNNRIARESLAVDKIIACEREEESLLIDRIIEKLEEKPLKKSAQEEHDKELINLYKEFKTKHVLIDNFKTLSNIFYNSISLFSTFITGNYFNDSRFANQSGKLYNPEKLKKNIYTLIDSLYDNYAEMNSIIQSGPISAYNGIDGKKFFRLSKISLDKITRLTMPKSNNQSVDELAYTAEEDSISVRNK